MKKKDYCCSQFRDKKWVQLLLLISIYIESFQTLQASYLILEIGLFFFSLWQTGRETLYIFILSFR